MLLSPDEYRGILRRDFATFIERALYEVTGKKLLRAPYVELIASKLEAMRLGVTRRQIINGPPRSIKSFAASVAFPAWILGHDPRAQVACASYGQDLSENLAFLCLKLMSSSFYMELFPTRIAGRKVADFTTTAGGGRKATSVGGPFTGRGADFIIVDDPSKPEDALSESGRKIANDWVGHTMLTRLDDKVKGAMAVIMQRLHQDDVTGYLMEQGGWEVLALAAIAMEDERHIIEGPLGRYVWTRRKGEVLHPRREPLEELIRLRATLGEYNFSAQYQQMPIPIGGAIVKRAWLSFYDRLPDGFSIIAQSWDTANKSSELANYSVCTTWGVWDSHFYLLDVFRKRLDYPDLRRAAQSLAERFKADVILVEDKASGTQLIQDLNHAGIYGVKPYSPPPGADKVIRLHAQTAKFESGKVLLPRQADWLDDYILEITGFPGTRYDDQVDSTAQALNYLNVAHDLEVWAKLAE